MSVSGVLPTIAQELALFAAVGFFLFAIDDFVVDILYFTRRLWRYATVYRRYPRAFGDRMTPAREPGWLAVFIPAWDEHRVIADMLASTLSRWGKRDYRLFVGYYPNDPRTARAIASVEDYRVIPVELPHDGPTTKADCLNHLYLALLEEERERGKSAKAVILHDAEDLVHPFELPLFDMLIEKAGAVQLPVVPLLDPRSTFIGGHYCDEFAESHGKELVVREAVGAAVPLAGVACAIGRDPLGKIAARQQGKPFDADSQTEDYELGLRIGQTGERTIFVRIPAIPGSGDMVASRGHFPGTFNAAVRQKARWIGGIAFAGWDRLGWQGGWGERWMRLRDRRGPLAALLLLTGYAALLLWTQLWIAAKLGAPVMPEVSPVLGSLLVANAVLLTWRVLMRALFTTMTYGPMQGLLSIPRLVVGNVIAIFASWRALRLHVGRRPLQWDKTDHVFPAEHQA
ncbi:glycosyl transferase family protein [Sphingomicrobium sp. XHP0235]|uniref:glycosyl transferase family protein n=1 Tax=Sphingomicrobium aquimarinum TaxID=3133971 RepID=UPI0031FF13CB